MIHARFERDGKNMLFSVTGHAGQNVNGCDIVCSAASMLAATLGQIVLFMHDEGKLKRHPTVRLDSGEAVITCRPAKSHEAEAFHAYVYAMTGFCLLEEAYPEYVKITNVW